MAWTATDIDTRINSLLPYILVKHSEATGSALTNIATGANAIGSATVTLAGGGPTTYNDGKIFTSKSANIDGAVGPSAKAMLYTGTQGTLWGAAPGLLTQMKTGTGGLGIICAYNFAYIDSQQSLGLTGNENIIRSICGGYEGGLINVPTGQGFDITLGVTATAPANIPGYTTADYQNVIAVRYSDNSGNNRIHLFNTGVAAGGQYAGFGADGLWRLLVVKINEATSTVSVWVDGVSIPQSGATLSTAAAPSTLSDWTNGRLTIGGCSVAGSTTLSGTTGRAYNGGISRIAFVPADNITDEVQDNLLKDLWYSVNGIRKVISHWKLTDLSTVYTDTGYTTNATATDNLNIKGVRDKRPVTPGTNANDLINTQGGNYPTTVVINNRYLGAGFADQWYTVSTTAGNRQGLAIATTGLKHIPQCCSMYAICRPMQANYLTSPTVICMGDPTGPTNKDRELCYSTGLLSFGQNQSATAVTTSTFPVAHTWPGRASFVGLSCNMGASGFSVGSQSLFQDGEFGVTAVANGGSNHYKPQSGGYLGSQSGMGIAGYGDQFCGIIEEAWTSDCPQPRSIETAAFAAWNASKGYAAAAWEALIVGDSVSCLNASSRFLGWQSYLFGTASEKGFYVNISFSSSQWDNQQTWDQTSVGVTANAAFSEASIVTAYGSHIFGSTTYANTYLFITGGVNDANQTNPNTAAPVTASNISTDLGTLTYALGHFTGSPGIFTKTGIQKLYNSSAGYPGSDPAAGCNVTIDSLASPGLSYIVTPGTIDFTGGSSPHPANVGHAQLGAAWAGAIKSWGISGDIIPTGGTRSRGRAFRDR